MYVEIEPRKVAPAVGVAPSKARRLAAELLEAAAACDRITARALSEEASG
jgi:hypothetical protein